MFLIDPYLVTDVCVVLPRLDLVPRIQSQAVPQVARPIDIVEWLQVQKVFSHYTPISGLCRGFIRMVVVNIVHKFWNSLKIKLY